MAVPRGAAPVGPIAARFGARRRLGRGATVRGRNENSESGNDNERDQSALFDRRFHMRISVGLRVLKPQRCFYRRNFITDFIAPWLRIFSRAFTSQLDQFEVRHQYRGDARGADGSSGAWLAIARGID